MAEFKREDRYIVIKLKDLQKIGGLTKMEQEYLDGILSVLPERKYVVVEDTWPEYEQVWKMIEERVMAQSLT